MTDAAIRRTIYRATAVLLVPLSFLPAAASAWLEHHHETHGIVLPGIGDQVSILLLLGAVGYLVLDLTSEVPD